MDQQKKLYVTAALLVAAGGLLVVQRQGKQADASSHSAAGLAAKLPKLELTEEKVATINKITLSKPAKDGAARVEIVLKKSGDEAWVIDKPMASQANASNVKSLLDNLPKLKLNEEISTATDDYDRWGVSDDKALKATFFAGEATVFDVLFGENGSRGQMTRLVGTDGVFAVKGFSKWLYERDVKGWRDKSMFKFDEKEVVKVSIENEHGHYAFEKNGVSWKGQFADKGALVGIKDFAPSKVDDLLRSYKTLSAIDFGDGKQPADTGLDKPSATVRIELVGGKALHELKLGGTAEGSNRWALTNGSEQVFAISSWSADWATAEVSKFQQTATEPVAGG